MSMEDEARRYTEEPALLVDLCRKVARQLGGGGNAAMEAQLRAIARSVADLERQGVPVPDVLRAEKTRLAAALEVTPDNRDTLELLAEGLEAVAKEIKSLVWRNRPAAVERTRRSAVSYQKTSRETLRRVILEVLGANGGHATPTDMFAAIEERMQGQFLPGDLEIKQRKDGWSCPAWQENIYRERKSMVDDGLLRRDSPRGVWELP